MKENNKLVFNSALDVIADITSEWGSKDEVKLDYCVPMNLRVCFFHIAHRYLD